MGKTRSLIAARLDQFLNSILTHRTAVLLVLGTDQSGVIRFASN